jgi:REP element-mobilizing transposase RayT
LEWKKLLQPDKYKQVIVESLRYLVAEKRIKVYGFVIMPNHLHLLWKMEKLHQRKDVQRDFMKFTAQQIRFDLIKYHPAVLEEFRVGAKDRQYQIWERNPLSVYLYSQPVTDQKLNYIHQNPVQEKWKLADLPEEYFYSSARFYLENQDDFGFLTHYSD